MKNYRLKGGLLSLCLALFYLLFNGVKSGYPIKRNKKYTGDGGIDGQATIKGVEYLIQTKRYKNYINPAHVQEFGAICKKQGKRGLFIHTGKTGAKSSKISKSHDLEMISGNRLLNMLTNSQK